MKRFLTLMLCAAVLFTVGCTNYIDEDVQVGGETELAINIDGRISQDYATRVDDGGFCGGDQVGLYGVNYTDANTVAGTLQSEGNQVNNALYTYDEANNAWSARGNIYYKDAETNIDLYAYYPYGHPENVNEWLFEVAQDQSGASVVDGYAASDFLWGKVEGVVPSSEKVKIKFAHRMSSALVALEMGEGWIDEAEWNNTSKGVLQSGVTRESSIDLATGEVVAVGEVSSEGTLMRETAEGWRSIVVPQEVEAGAAMFAIDIDGVRYRFRRNDAYVFESGKMHKFTITTNKKVAEGTYELVLTDSAVVEWTADLETHGGEARQYYVVHLDEPGTLEATIAAAKKDPAKIKNLKVSGNIDAEDFLFMRDKMDILQAINLKESRIIGVDWYYDVTIDGVSKKVYFHGGLPSTDSERRAMVKERFPNATTITYQSCNISGLPDDAIPTDAFSNKSTLVYFVFPEKVTKIGGDAFSNTMLSGALVIPDDVVEIGRDAFNNTLISSVQFPVGLKHIGSSAFNFCGALAGNLVLPEGLESLGDYAFRACKALSGTLTLPEGLKSIPNSCFDSCTGLSGDLVIPEGVESIGDSAFNSCSGLNGTLSLPSTLKEIGREAFDDTNLKGELVIPEGVAQISRGAFAQCSFSSVVLPEGLLRIDEDAFDSNDRLSAPLIFPSTLQFIGAGAFDGCYALTSIEFGKGLTTIQASGFRSCSKVEAITSHATVPPTALNYAFSGVPKDKFVVKVPAASVVKYQTASQWNEFQYEAYYDFEVDSPVVKGDNTSLEYNVALTAPNNYEWTIDISLLPDWVTVSPTSGIGSTTLTVTLGQLTAGEGDRTTQIVVELVGKDTNITIDVNQVDLGASNLTDGEVIVNQTATEGNGVNVIFMGEGYDANDIANGLYTSDINEAIGHFFGVEPFTTYRDYFNVYTVVAVSQDSGISTQHFPKKTAFKAQYKEQFGLKIHEQSVFKYAMKVDGIDKDNVKETLIVLIVNSSEYGGISYLWEDGSSIAVCPKTNAAYPYDFRGIVQHEACGHAFGKLGDENVKYSGTIEGASEKNKKHKDELKKNKERGWNDNLSLSGNMSEVEWSHLMTHDNYCNVVDIYEGGYYYTNGVYRSEDISCMGTHKPYFSAISRESIVKRIMKYAGQIFDLQDFYDKDVRDAGSNRVNVAAKNGTKANNNADAALQAEPQLVGFAPIFE